MLARPHWANALLAYHTPHTHLELKRGTQGIRYQRPLCMDGHVLLEGLLDTGQEGVYGLLALGAGHFSGDVQKTDHGVSVIVVLQGLFPGLLLHCVSCIALFSGLHDSCHVFPGRSSRVLAMREVNGGVNALHVACSGLYHLLPGGHDRYDPTDIVSVDAGYVP